MAKKTQSTNSLSYQVSEIKSLMQDLQNQVKQLGEEGKGVVDVFKKINDPLRTQVSSMEALSEEIKRAKESIIKFMETSQSQGKLDEKTKDQQTKALNRLISLEGQLQRSKKTVLGEIQNVAREEQRVRALKQKAFEEEFNASSKAKADLQEISAGESEINRLLREKATHESDIAQEVYKRREAEKQAIQDEKEAEKLRLKSLEEQRDLEQFMLENSLKAQADKIKNEEDLAAQAAQRKKEQAAEEAKLSQQEALTAIENARQEQKVDDQLGLAKIRTSKQTVNKRAAAENAYWEELQSRYDKDSSEYKELEIQKLNATKKYEKERQAVVNKYRSSRPKASAEEKGGFFSQFKDGIVSKNIGKTLGRLTGITAAVQIFRSALQAVKRVFVQSFKAAVDFEAQLANLQAVTGINNSELSKLEKNVLSVAGSTKFTSEEIVQLQTELGKLGFSVSEIEAATLAVARTAQALGEKVGPVAQRIGQILNQFNLSAAETTRVSDSLVSVINSSALSFEGFSTALQYIGPLGAEVGTTFEETAVAMALLADNGFTASRIGTGLRGIMTELSKTGKDLNTVISELAEEEITLAEAVDLVGKRNAAQLLTLVEAAQKQREVGKSLEDLNDQYFAQGSAAIAAAQQVDTFQGNLDLLKSAVNRVQISFGNFLKTSKLLRFALKLIDEEGYNAALSAEAVSGSDPTAFSQKLSEAADIVGGLKRELTAVAEVRAFEGIAASRIVSETIIKPLEAELAALKRLREERRKSDLERTAEIDTLLQGNLALEERNKLTKERAQVSAAANDTTDFKANRAEYAVINNLEKRIQDRKEAGFNAEIQYVKSLLDEVGLQKALELQRNEIILERKDILEDLRNLADNESISLKEANDLNVKLNKESKGLQGTINELLAEQEDRKEKGNEIVGEELLLFEAKLNQYKQEKDSLSNLVFQKSALEKLAQKEFEKEFKQLANRIEARKQQLEDEQALLDVAILTEQNLSRNARTEKERIDATERLTTLQQKRLTNETKAFNDLNGVTKEYANLIDAVGVEIERAGLDGRFIEKAKERLDSFRLGFNALALDIGDIAKAGEVLADSLYNVYKIDLKAGTELDPKQLADVDKQIKDLIRKLLPGLEIISPDAFEAIYEKLQPLVMSKLIADPKDDEQERKKKIKKLLDSILDELTDAAKAYNDTILQNTQGRLDAELEAIKQRYKTEEEILKSQLDNQLITESQYRVKSNEIKRKQIQEENEINKQKFEAEKKSDLANVVIDLAEAVASNLINNFGSTDTVTATGLSAAGYAALVGGAALKADAIRRRKFFPVKFEEGGIVQGPSHDAGGVPFSVQGQGGYEMEGGEFIVNKKAAQFHRSLLERINNSAKPNTNITPLKFAQGGLVSAQRASQVNVKADTKESVNYLKAIAEATVSTAISSNKPLRAFVSTRDLRSSENERRLKERNDRI